MADAITAMLVDDHAMLVDLFEHALRAADITVAVAKDLTDDGILRRCEEVQPDVVVLDLHLGGAESSLHLIRPLRARGAEVLVLTGSAAPGDLGLCLMEGATATIEKSERLPVIVQAVRDVATGRAVMRPAKRDELVRLAQQTRARHRAGNERFSALTAREQQVFRGLIAGRTAEQIATEDGVSVGTVRVQIKSILKKLGVNSQIAAVGLARELGWPADHSG